MPSVRSLESAACGWLQKRGDRLRDTSADGLWPTRTATSLAGVLGVSGRADFSVPDPVEPLVASFAHPPGLAAVCDGTRRVRVIWAWRACLPPARSRFRAFLLEHFRDRQDHLERVAERADPDADTPSSTCPIGFKDAQ